MALKLKKSNIINTSSKDMNLMFEEFSNKINESWVDKRIAIENGKNLLKDCLTNGIEFTPDDLKNLSLITYIDAPWGSGKTRFVEEYIKWIVSNKRGKKVKVIDAWEVYNGSNINQVLWEIFKVPSDDEELKKNIQKYQKMINGNVDKKLELSKIAKRSSFIGDLIISQVPAANIVYNITKFSTKKAFKIAENKSAKFGQYHSLITKDLSESQETEVLTSAISKTIEKRNGNKGENNLIFIDNIERLSSENRLDVVNKILNWANFSGVTYVFLTNFEKIKFTKVWEEDFWNKIALQETFKLVNNWKSFLEDYTYFDKTNSVEFKLSNFKLLHSFIEEILPTFFTSNNDNMDIREIKKLIDNWTDKTTIETEIDLINSFYNYLVNSNLSGLDKYFIINRTITMLTEDEKYWKLWEEEFEQIFKECDLENIDETPLFNNKSLRIQSNFYNLQFKCIGDLIELVPNDLELSSNEQEEFKLFNNFIDDVAVHKYKEFLKSLFDSRKIISEESKENYLKILYEKTDYRKYFEFKYNNLKKIYLYNKILDWEIQS